MKMDITMAYRVFTLPVHNRGAAETELNGFLASHRVLSVDRRFVEEGERVLEWLRQQWGGKASDAASKPAF
jgi:hypothetical protein